MNRREFVFSLAGLGLTAHAVADTRLPKGVTILFDGPVPNSAVRIKHHLAQRFAGDVLPFVDIHKSRLDSANARLMVVANGPRIKGGQSAFLCLIGSDKVAFDPRKDAIRGAPREGYSADNFRPAWLIGERPYALIAKKTLRVASLEHLASIAKHRDTSGKPLECWYAGDFGNAIANRLARLMSAKLMLNDSIRDLNIDEVSRKTHADLFITPISPTLTVDRFAQNWSMVSALCMQGQPVVYKEWGKASVDDGLPRLAPDSSFASLAMVPTQGLFVSAQESPDVVDALFESFKAAFQESEVQTEYSHLVLLSFDNLEQMDQRFAAEVAAYLSCVDVRKC